MASEVGLESVPGGNVPSGIVHASPPSRRSSRRMAGAPRRQPAPPSGVQNRTHWFAASKRYGSAERRRTEVSARPPTALRAYGVPTAYFGLATANRPIPHQKTAARVVLVACAPNASVNRDSADSHRLRRTTPEANREHAAAMARLIAASVAALRRYRLRWGSSPYPLRVAPARGRFYVGPPYRVPASRSPSQRR